MDFEYEIFEPRKDDWTDVATRRPTDAEDGSVENYVIENERGSASETESHSERSNEDDVNENETRTQSRNSRDASSPWDETTNSTQNENDVTNDLQNAGNVSNRGADITVPGISEKENSEENSSPRGGRYNLRPNPNPNVTAACLYPALRLDKLYAALIRCLVLWTVTKQFLVSYFKGLYLLTGGSDVTRGISCDSSVH